MKKTYSKPIIEVMEMRTQQMLASSTRVTGLSGITETEEYSGETPVNW